MSGGSGSVLCVLSDEQAEAYRDYLDGLRAPGVDLVLEPSAENALEEIGRTGPRAVIVGMTIGAMEGLEFIATAMRRYGEYGGAFIVLPDRGDPFPPMLQRRDPSTGRSSTEQTDLDSIVTLLGTLATERPLPSSSPPRDMVAGRIARADDAERSRAHLASAKARAELASGIAVAMSSAEPAPPVPSAPALDVFHRETVRPADAAASADATVEPKAAPKPSAVVAGAAATTMSRAEHVTPRERPVKAQVPPVLRTPSDAERERDRTAPSRSAPDMAPATKNTPASAAHEAPAPQDAPASGLAPVATTSTPEAAERASLDPPAAASTAAEPTGASPSAPAPDPSSAAWAPVSAPPVAASRPVGKWVLFACAVVLAIATCAWWLFAHRASPPDPSVAGHASATTGAAENHLARPMPNAPPHSPHPSLVGANHPTAIAKSPLPVAHPQPRRGGDPDLASSTTLPLRFARGHASFEVADAAAFHRIVTRTTEALRTDPAARVEIGGHTSAEGGEAFNRSLGRRRARQVRRALVDRGVDRSRLVLRSYGASMPVGSDEEGNRRVTLRLIH